MTTRNLWRAAGSRKGARERGFSLLEVLIAMVVLSIGLLGIAAMSIESFRHGQSALLRSKALNLAADMADTIRANRRALQVDPNAFVVGFADDGTDNGCTDTIDADGNEVPAVVSCAPDDMAEHAVFLWKQMLADPRLGLPGGNGAIARQGATPVRYTITVAWTEKGENHQYDLRGQVLIPGGP